MSRPLTSNTLHPQAHAKASVVEKPTSDPNERKAVAKDVANAAMIFRFRLNSFVALNIFDMVSHDF